jgi:hypothetical protein
MYGLLGTALTVVVALGFVLAGVATVWLLSALHRAINEAFRP